MRVFVFVNRVQEIGFRQTTALLTSAFLERGCEVFIAAANGLSISGQSSSCEQRQPSRGSASSGLKVLVRAACVEIDRSHLSSRSVAAFTRSIPETQFAPTELTPQDLIFIRTNPGRDQENIGQHTAFLEMCEVAKSSGIRVINDPSRLSFFASKAAVLLLPTEYRPEMIVTDELVAVRRFIEGANRPCVIKPLVGSRGKDVVLVNTTKDLENSVSRFDGRTVVAQHFIESETPGDMRVVVLNGTLLEHNGQIAGIHRIPSEGEFRANLHVGGSAKKLTLSPKQKEAAIVAATMLLDAGIVLAGIDLIGSKVIEFNVFSTGGLYDANQFAQHDFCNTIVSSLTRA